MYQKHINNLIPVNNSIESDLRKLFIWDFNKQIINDNHSE